jgi:hypothetical protein
MWNTDSKFLKSLTIKVIIYAKPLIQCSLVIMKSNIINTFRLFGWFAFELILKNWGYSELEYSESQVITKAF